MTSLKEALAAIPGRRDKLDVLDRRLTQVITHVEHVLRSELRMAVPCAVTYETADGRFFLSYGKMGGRWQLIWGREDDDDTKDTPITGASRLARSEIFITEPTTGQSPIERLIIGAAEALLQYAGERTPQVETANRVLEALADAGFPLAH